MISADNKKNAGTLKKSHLRRWLFCWVVLLSCLLVGCDAKQSSVELSGHTMGTTWHVTYFAPQGAAMPFQMRLQADIQRVLDEINGSMSTYRADSEISQFNQLNPNQWFAISADFLVVLQAAMSVGNASGGAYDVTVAALVNLWGFGPDGQANSIPEHAQLTELLQTIGQDKLSIDVPAHKILKSAALSLDFSSIAKGYGVDRVADWLAEQGVENYLVEVGGEMRLAGHKIDKQLWRVAIEQPDGPLGSVATAINLTDQAIATSGDYRNYFEIGTKRYSHTIDPRTGYPVDHDLVSVTVVHPSAMMADAWATALTVLGADEGMKVAIREGLAVYFIQRDVQVDNTRYRRRYSPQFDRFVEDEEEFRQ